MRARGVLVEVRAADLRFTADEAEAFLNDVMGLRLETALVSALEAGTGGGGGGVRGGAGGGAAAGGAVGPGTCRRGGRVGRRRRVRRGLLRKPSVRPRLPR